MIIECWQRKVSRVEVVSSLSTFATTGALATVPVIKPIVEHGGIDPFAAYYEASRQPRVHGPHHAFANLTNDEAISPFFERFGFPYFHGREILLGEVLIEAKRLRLLMDSWEAFRAADLAGAQRHLGELAFARSSHQAHWFYWPPSLHPDASEEGREEVSITRQSLEAQFTAACDRKMSLASKEDLYRELVFATVHVCVSPLTQVEFAPEVEPQDNGISLRWSLRPVRFLGEEERDRELYVYEEPYVAAPYGLMFLLDLSAGNEARVCADPFCRQIFGAGRRNQMFCGQACAHRTAVRKSRERRTARRQITDNRRPGEFR